MEKKLLRQSSSAKTGLRSRLAYRIILPTVALSVVIFFLTTGVNLFKPEKSFAAANGDYQSVTSGNWDSAGTWQKSTGTSWVAATSAPTSSNGVITIRSGHTVTVRTNVTVDQVVVASGGIVVINSSVTLSINNDLLTANDCDVTGILKNAGTVTRFPSATLTFENGGKYQHNYTTSAGTIPTATWSTGSTCEIIGYTSNSNPPGGLQVFSNFTWNCASQTAAVNFKLTSWTINGNFSVLSTGSSQLAFNDNDFTLTTGGDYIQSGGTFTLCDKNGKTGTFNIGGNYNQTGGTFSAVTGTGSTAIIKVTGNWSHTGGTLNVTGDAATNAQIQFRNPVSQTVTTSGNTVSGNVDFTVNTNSALVMGTSILTGRKFTLSSGASISIGNTSGISVSGTTGNIQSTGTRSFSTTANYNYNGSAAQITGMGLPATVNNLIINNSNGVTLSDTVFVTNILTLTSGKIITGVNEIKTLSTAATSITGYSSSNYIIGNLRRTVSGSGTYDFPVGTASNYELARLTLTGATGFTSVLGYFTNANPIVPGLSLRSIYIDKFTMNKMLDYGYWTLTPNSAMTGGNYTVTLNESGQSNKATYPSLYCVLKRTNSSSVWQSLGNHNSNTQSESGGVVTAARSGLTSFSDFGIAYGVGFMIFENDSLISGVDGQPGAIYLFPDVSDNIDAWVQILSLDGGATLADIDHFTAGYDEAFQPFINAASNGASSILWRITFKKANTPSDTILGNISLIAVDVDGNGGSLREFVETNDFNSYSYAPSCFLNLSVNNGYINATSPVTNVADIDTTQLQAMFQIDKRNVRTMTYRTGAIGGGTTGSSLTRQNCLFFKPFFSTPVTLPVTLSGFSANTINNTSVLINWTTASEQNNDYFTLERSANGRQFAELSKIKGSGSSSIVHKYSYTDDNPLSGISYYRLTQTDYNGHSETFKPVSVSNGSDQNVVDEVSVYPNPFRDFLNVQFELNESDELTLQLLNLNGSNIFSQKMNATKGRNEFRFTSSENLAPGLYIFRISNGKNVLSNLKVLCKK